MVDEVLGAIGVPLIRATGSLRDDWPAIRPYVEQAMLPTTEDGDREPSDQEVLNVVGGEQPQELEEVGRKLDPNHS